MRLVDRLRHWFRATFRERSVESQVTEELDACVAELTARHTARGLGARDARARALAEVGNLDAVKQTIRDERSGAVWRELRPEMRHAWRSLRRAPGLTAAIVLTFALGIGANTAIFSVVHAMLLAPLPFKDPSRVVMIWSDMTAAGYPRAPFSGPELQDLRDRTTRFDGLGAIWSTQTTLTDNEPEQLRIGLVTTNFFSVLGASPALGRTFGPEDETSAGTSGIVLSWPLFERRFGARPSVVGENIQVSGRPTTVIGVMPKGFRLMLPPDAGVPDTLEAWTVLRSAGLARSPRGQQYLRVVGRMKPGVRLAEARQEVDAVAAAISREFTEYGRDGRRFLTVSLHDDDVREVRPALLVLTAGVAMLLLIACVNVAALLVARAAGRRDETALRLALGANRRRLFRQYFIEALVLTGIGAAVGIAAGWAGLHAVLNWRPDSLSRIDSAAINPTVLLVTAAITAGWALLLSLAPLTESFRTNVIETLQHAGQRAGSVMALRTRTGLVIAQLALSTVLLVGAGLLTRAFIAVEQRELGYQPEHAMTFRLAIPFARYGSTTAIDALTSDIMARLRALPGVTSVSAISHVPFDDQPNWGGGYVTSLAGDTSTAPLADYRAVSPGFFSATGVRLLEGRAFAETDDRSQPFVVVVDDLLARRTWPGRSAIGERLFVDPGSQGSPSVEARVIGVVAHLRLRSLIEDLSEQVYFSSRQTFRSSMAYIVKTSGDPESLPPSIRKAVLSADRLLPIYGVRQFESYTNEARAGHRFLALIAGIFAAVALLLTAVGVYGVIAYSVTCRSREFGVRLALGATPRQIALSMLGQGSVLTIAGLVLGAVAAIVLAAAFGGHLAGVTPFDPVSYLSAIGTLAAVALAAAWLPSRRATSSNPLEVLRRD